jgi:predicted Fe-S protein YdhL (DUF1289 family)
MARFPKIQSPCPYVDRLASIMDGDVCRMCKRQVFELTDMSDAQREDFLKSCAGREVCVSYRIRPALVGAALAAAVVGAPASAAAQIQTVIVVAGGLRSTKHIEYVETAADRATPPLPVVYEEKSSADKNSADRPSSVSAKHS